MKKIYFLFVAIIWAILAIPTITFAGEIDEVVVIWDKSKWKRPSLTPTPDTTINPTIKIPNQPTAKETDDCEWWIRLNTNMPFLGNCIHTSENAGEWAITPINAFPTLVGTLMNLLMTIILLMSLIMIIRSWVLMAMSWANVGKYSDWVNLLKRVATWMALLGASWAILKVINPNFFV